MKAIAEVETPVMQNGRGSTKLKPANLVVPGDRVIYTLEIRNAGASVVHAPWVAYAIPAHVMVVPDSASGPGAEVSYSADGGRTFERAENLRVAGGDGRPRAAKPEEFTHIRWQLHHDLKANSVAYARFRAVVK